MEGESGPPDNASSLRVLLVEDSALQAERIVELVKRLPHVQVTAVVATQADAEWQIHECHPDVVILDLHLHEGTGFGVLLARHRATHPKVIVFADYDSREYRRTARTLGAYAFFDKSRDFGRLGSLLLTLAEERAGARGALV